MKAIKTLLLLSFPFFSLNLFGQVSVKDTVIAIKDNTFVNYPIGEFKNFKDFTNSYKGIHWSVSTVKPYKNDIKEKARTFAVGKSYVKLYLNKQSKKLEVVNAIILSKDIPIQKDIIVGIDRKDFLKRLNISGNDYDKATVINIKSITGDINHYYRFQNDKLIGISIFSPLFYDN